MTRALPLLLCLIASPAQAKAGPEAVESGVPALDPRDETPIVAKAVAKPVAAETAGAWSQQPGQVVLDKVEKAGAWWLAAHGEGPLQDGFVRGRIAFDGKDAAGLAVRAKVERIDKLTFFHGYVVGPSKGRLEIRRVQGGASTTLAAGATVGCKSTCSLEIAVWMVGPHLAAQFFDGETLKPLGSLVASDAALPSGLFGVRHQGGQPMACRGLWVRKANTPLPPRAGALGRMRYLAVPAGQLAVLDDLDTKVVSRSESEAIVQTGSAGKEAVLRRLPEAREVFADEPLSFRDASFRAAAAKPVVPTPTGFVTDASYKDPAMTEALLRAYAQRFPKVAQLVEIGKSRQGRSIWALKLHHGGQPEDAVPQVLINGAHHGVELAALEFAIDGCAYLAEHAETDPEVSDWLQRLTVWCVPLVNPDGNHLYVHVSKHGGRKNGRDTDGNGRPDPTDGVDLNRNYPYRWHTLGEGASHSDPRRAWYRGPRAGSEPETQTMLRLADDRRFLTSVSFHTQANAILVPYTIPQAPDPEPNEAWSIAEAMAQRAGPQVNGRHFTVKRRLYPVDGVDQDWHRAAHGTSAFLVEGTLTNPGMERLRKMVVATRGTWMGLLQRTLAGPGLWGRVRDSQGRPVSAEIRVRQVATKDGERWTSRCQDGRFGRMLPATGSFDVDVVGADGKTLATQKVEVGSAGLAQVELTIAGAQPATSCSRADLCAVDSLCAAETGSCAVAGPARFCRIDGRCVARGSQSPAGRCNPDRDPWTWSST